MRRYLLAIPLILLFSCKDTHTEHHTKEETVNNEHVATPGEPAAIPHAEQATQGAEMAESGGTGDNAIEAGKRIGKVYLGMDTEELNKVLGEPDESDAAMGKAWLTWYGKKRDRNNNITELNIYTAYKDSTMQQKTVQQVRTTSSYFSTAEGISVYDGIREVLKVHNRTSGMGNYHLADHRRVTIYDDIAKGIAFDIVETDGKEICIGITVHPAGKTVRDTYISLHPEQDTR